VLSLFGTSGSGKSVLCAALIDALQRDSEEGRRESSVAYFFCRSSENPKCSTTDICATIISQLALQSPELHPSLLLAHNISKRYGRLRRCPRDDLKKVLIDMASSLPRVYIVIDGLDECDDAIEPARMFLEVAEAVSSVRVLFGARPLRALRELVKSHPTIEVGLELTGSDINQYLRSALITTPVTDDMIETCVAKLSRAANGMFLYAHLSIQALHAAVDPQHIAKILETLPEGINDFYARYLTNLAGKTPEVRRLANTVLRWVCCARRPLHWLELQQALSWDESTSAFDDLRKPFKSIVIDSCFPLVEYRERDDAFVVSHQSVKDFLCQPSSAIFDNEEAAQFLVDETKTHSAVARCLLGVFTDLRVLEKIQHPSKDISRLSPLSSYATVHWVTHLASSAADDTNLRQTVEQFMSDSRKRLLWLTLYVIHEKSHMPLGTIIRLQKSIRAWTLGNAAQNTTPLASGQDLLDIQQALIALDAMGGQLSGQQLDFDSMPPISAFERILCVRDLARACTASGQADAAIQVFNDLLHTTTGHTGNEALGLAWIHNSLGLLYDQKHDVSLAMQAQRQALSIQQRHLPPEHFDIVGTVNELGRLHRHLGEYDASENCHRQALTVLNKYLPPTDLHVIWTNNTLGRCLQKAGRPHEALDLHRSALRNQRETLGPDHPHAIWTLGDIARCQRDLGQFSDAVVSLLEAHSRRTALLGPRHPDTLWVLNDLGLLYEQMRNVQRAVEAHTEARDGQVEVLGAEHPHAAWSQQRLQGLLPG
jgi:tetratricopeptide (TPR) repeat protein